MKMMNDPINTKEKIAQNLYLFYKGERVAIEPSEIIYLEADINYTKFFMKTKRLTSSFTLKFFNDVLKNDPAFLRINKSYLINLNYLERIFLGKNAKVVMLKNGVQLPVSRRKMAEVKTKIFNNIIIL